MKELLILMLLSTPAFGQLQTFDGDKIREIEIENTSGNISFSKSDSKKIELFIERKKFGSNCKLETKTSGKELEIEVENSDEKISCRVHFSFKIPKDMDIEIKNGAGNIELLTPAKRLDFILGAGATKVNGDVVTLEGKVGSGNISFVGKSKEIDLQSGAGNISISLPAESTVDADLNIGFGNVSNDFKHDPKGKTELEVKVGTGNIRISKIK